LFLPELKTILLLVLLLRYSLTIHLLLVVVEVSHTPNNNFKLEVATATVTLVCARNDGVQQHYELIPSASPNLIKHDNEKYVACAAWNMQLMSVPGECGDWN
jgi:hypothetical protein